MYKPNSSNQSFFINQPTPDEELGIPQQRFQNHREMREAISVEIEKEERRNREIKSEINRLERELLLPGSEYRSLVYSDTYTGVFARPLSNHRLIVPQWDLGMSVEEKLARNCEEKRLVEKAAAARRQRYDG